ncbi:MAG: caspase family protein [Mesorhizobium sp.]
MDDEVAVWTADYFYDATAEAAALIDLKFPGKLGLYSLDRFGASRHIPGLAQKLIYQDEQLAEGVELGVPPSLQATITLSDDGMILVAPKFEKSEVSKLYVLQDGIVTNSFEAGEVGGELRVARLKDARWISFVAADGQGLVSLPVTADIGAPKERRAINRALVVGVNTYYGEGLNSLNYALLDAGQVYDVLSAVRENGPVFQVELGPKDRKATPNAIVEATKRMVEGLGKGDHAVLFLAGHGLRDEQGVFYFATSQTELSDLPGTALSFDRLSAIFDASEAQITVMLDTCHSGAAGTGAFATNDELANKLLANGANVMIISAAKGRQQSQGRAETGGLFTHAIAQVLGGQREKYDLNANGSIEVSEFYRGVKALVGEASSDAQTPWIIRPRMVGEYALF